MDDVFIRHGFKGSWKKKKPEELAWGGGGGGMVHLFEQGLVRKPSIVVFNRYPPGCPFPDIFHHKYDQITVQTLKVVVGGTGQVLEGSGVRGTDALLLVMLRHRYKPTVGTATLRQVKV